MSPSSSLSSIFLDLGDPDALILRALKSAPGPSRPNNSHIHLPPNFSAFDTVAQPVELAAQEGVEVLGVSNYYDYGVYGEFARLARDAGIFPLFGTEIIALLDDLVQAGIKINDPGNPGKMYLCGKGLAHFDPMSAEATALLEVIRQKDSTRMAAMVARMAELFAESGFDAELDEAAVKARVVARHGCPPETVYLQERHVAQAFQEVMAERLTLQEQAALLTRLYGAPPRANPAEPVPTQNEMRSMLMKAGKPGYVTETFVDFDHAYRLVLALGGIPCYPTLADGARPVCGFEETPAALVEQLVARGIHCAEFIPDRNTPESLAGYARALRAAGIVVTAGTEHNTRELIPIAPACKGGAPIPEDVAELFWEGACVVAAHQYLASRGHGGFVDGVGEPNPCYGSAEERIRAFRAIGDRVIAEALPEDRTRPDA